MAHAIQLAMKIMTTKPNPTESPTINGKLLGDEDGEDEEEDEEDDDDDVGVW